MTWCPMIQHDAILNIANVFLYSRCKTANSFDMDSIDDANDAT